MKHKILKCILSAYVLSLLLMWLPASQAQAASWHIYDDGGFFTDSEISELEKQLSNYEKETGIEILIITVQGISYSIAERYLDNTYDSMYADNEVGRNAVLMLYGEQERFCQLQGYGITEKYITSQRIEKMLDGLVPLFKEKKYKNAALYFAEKAVYYTGRHPVRDTIIGNIWFQLLVAAGIGAIAVGCMAASSGGKVTIRNTTYLDSSHSGITAHRDQYIRTSVTKRKRPQQTSGGGGGSSSGRTSGGHSRSSGGRKF